MNEEKRYCGQPVTRCAKIIAWTGAFLCIFSLITAATTNANITDPPFVISICFTLMFYLITIIGLRKEHPTWILISSIIMLINAIVSTLFVVLLIYAAIALPENIVEIFKQGKITEKEARKVTRIICFGGAFLNFLCACFTSFGYKVFSDARKYYLQRGSYIAPSILENA